MFAPISADRLRMQKPIKAIDLANRMVGGKLSEMANYSDLFQKTNDAIFLLDIESHKVLECNPAAAKLLGRQPIQDESFLQWAAPQSRKNLENNLRVFQINSARELSFDLQLTNEVILEVNSSSLKLEDYCEVIQIIAKDVTKERNAMEELKKSNQRLAILSTTDEMTRIFNFRHFKQELTKEHARAKRHKKPYAIILCDVDHFKNFNDKNGHVEGDKALIQTAAILRERSRQTDIVARYGGEEFVVLCPEAGITHALILAEALREKVAAEKYAHGEKQPLGKVTISIGVASYPSDGAEPEEILRHADEALYTAKAGGRNLVKAYAPGSSLKKTA